MHFEESYFEGEEREGFYIEPMMKRAWAAQLEVLETVDEICRRNNIEYFASSGTLLGAIRHGGYIPWDDDLDIEMKRLDYERFLKIAERELPQGYKILNSRKWSKYGSSLSRVVNTMEIPLECERLQQFHGFPWSAGVDIFPLDYLPVDKSEEDVMLKLFSLVYGLVYNWNLDVMSEEEKIQSLREIELYCNTKFTEDKPYEQQLWLLVDRISSMYWDTETVAKEISIIYTMPTRPMARIPVSCYEQVKRVPFENTTVPIPIGYKQVLTAYYDEDYMIPKRGTAEHGYPFYRKQERLLQDFCRKNGYEMPADLYNTSMQRIEILQ